jgi:hypothetical protein
MTRCLATERQFTGYGRRFVLSLVIGALALAAGPVSATSIVPVSARELVARADVIVHGVAVGSHVGEDALGRPETITIITPLAVLKGHVSGALVLHHEEPGHRLGGSLGDRVLPVRERGARRRRRSARQPPGPSPPAKQLEHDQDDADDPGRDAGGQLLHHRGGR